MPDIKASIDFLANLDLYNHEKPYAALASPGTVVVGEDQLHNLQWETHRDVHVTDIRGNEKLYNLEECGFQVVRSPGHQSVYTNLEELEKYKRGTEQLLSTLLKPTQVHCYEARVRDVAKLIGNHANFLPVEREC